MGVSGGWDGAHARTVLDEGKIHAILRVTPRETK